MKIIFSVIMMLSVIQAHAMEVEPDVFGTLVDQNGNIGLPENYRSQWTHLGSWLVAEPEAPGHGFHDVYMQEDAVRYYRNTGRFPDGAVIVKEVRKLVSGSRTTGLARWAGDVNVWFVMVRDTRGRFSENVHWANGWGWALFKNDEAGDTALKVNVSEGFATTCQACHLPAQNSDWVFIEGYPELRTDLP